MPPPRILAIDPGTRYMGVVVLEGSDLIHYGVKDLRTFRPGEELVRATREVVERLISDYGPRVLAYEKSYYVQSNASALLQRQEAELKRVGQEVKLRVLAYFPSAVRAAICNDSWATKAMVAKTLIRRFPELADWHAQDDPQRARYWLHMFDALAVAVLAAHAGEASAGASGAERAA